MTEQPLDPRREKLVGLLYGELSTEEEQEIRKQIAEDESLRADWEELVAAREMIGEWDVAAETPSFVFLDEQAPAREERQLGFWDRLRERFGGFVTATPWAMATAAVVIAVLALSDFRVTREGGTLAFGFGERESETPAQALQFDPQGGGGFPLEGTPVQQASSNPVLSDNHPYLVPATSPFLTRDEFEAYTAGMTQTMVALINQYGREQQGQTSSYLQAIFGGFAERQDDSYRELRARIEALRLGLTEEQFKTNVQVDYLMQQEQPGLVPVVNQAPSDGSGGK
jgi:hypothetical protein